MNCSIFREIDLLRIPSSPKRRNSSQLDDAAEFVAIAELGKQPGALNAMPNEKRDNACLAASVIESSSRIGNATLERIEEIIETVSTLIPPRSASIEPEIRWWRCA